MSKYSTSLSQLLQEAIAQDGGLAVFRYYGFEPNNRPQKTNPFRDERTSSFFITQKFNKIIFKDFGDDNYKGDCRKFIQLYENLNAEQTFQRLCEIYQLYSFGLAPKKPIQIQKSSPKSDISTAQSSLLSIDFKEFTKEELDFWIQKGNITLHTLNENGVKSLASFSIRTSKGKILSFHNLSFVFAYEIVPTKAYKLYMPKPAHRVYTSSKTVFLPNLESARQQFGEEFSYSFGLKTLDKTKPAILCGGEPDCLALKSAGYNAFTLGDERATIPTYISKQLPDYYPISVLYDTDYTGLKASKILAEKYQFQQLILPKLSKQLTQNHPKPTQNDVCDYFQLFGWDEDIQITLHQSIYENQDYRLPHTTCFEVKNYLSEKTDVLVKFIQQNKRIQADADAGIGKTYTMLVEVPPKINQAMLFVVPFAIQVEQIEKEYAAKVPDLMCFTNKNVQLSEDDEFALLHQPIGKVNVCTYDRIKAVYQRLQHEYEQNILIVVDESHLLTSEYAYRTQAIHEVLNVCNETSKLVYLSATPDYSLCKFAHFKLIRFKRQENPIIQIQAIDYEGNPKKVILKFILEKIFTITNTHTITKQGIHIIRLNNKTLAKVIANLLISKGYFQENEIDFVFSEKRKGVSTPTKESIVQDSQIPDDVKLLFVTACFDCGINIQNENIAQIVSFETRYTDNCKDTLKQFIARFRNLKNVQVTVCKPLKYSNLGKIQSKAKLYDRLLKDAQNKLALLPYNDVQYLETLEKQAHIIAQFGLNTPQTPRYIKTNSDISAIHKLLYKDNRKQQYKINYNYIRFILKEYERKNLNSQTFYEELEKELPNAHLIGREKMTLNPRSKNYVEFQKLLQEVKEQRKSKIEKVCETIQQNETVFFDAVHAEYRDIHLKKEIKKSFAVSPPKQAKKMAEILEDDTLRKGMDEEILELSKRYFYLNDLLIPRKQIPTFLKQYADDVSFGIFTKTLVNQINLLAKELTGNGVAQLITDYRKLEDVHWLGMLIQEIQTWKPQAYKQKKNQMILQKIKNLEYDLKIAEYQHAQLLQEAIEYLFKIREGEKCKALYRAAKRKYKTSLKRVEKIQSDISHLQNQLHQSQINAFEINELSEKINKLRPHQSDWQGTRTNIRLLGSLFDLNIFKRSVCIDNGETCEKYFVEIGKLRTFQETMMVLGFEEGTAIEYETYLRYQILQDWSTHRQFLSKNLSKSTESSIHVP